MAGDAQIIAIHESSVDVRSETLNITREIVLGDDDWMKIPYYFDKFGIYIDAEGFARDMIRFRYHIRDINQMKGYRADIYYYTRLHALKAAIPKAFEIR